MAEIHTLGLGNSFAVTIIHFYTDSNKVKNNSQENLFHGPKDGPLKPKTRNINKNKFKTVLNFVPRYLPNPIHRVEKQCN